MTQTATTEKAGRMPAPLEEHRVFVGLWVWRGKLELPRGMNLSQGRELFWAAVERQNVTVLGAHEPAGKGWTSALEVEGTNWRDLQVLHERLATELMGSGIHLVELRVETLAAEWRAAKD